MGDFPGYIEITCPCCGRHRHTTIEKLPALREYVYVSATDVVCDDCWEVVQYFVKKAIGRGT